MMRRRLLIMALLCGTLGVVLSGVNPRNLRLRHLDAVLPGRSVRTFAALDPSFRPLAKGVFEACRRRGFTPEISSAWRSDKRQEVIFGISLLNERLLGGSPGTRVRGGQSYHNHVDKRGAPASLALDVHDAKAQSLDDKVRFYKVLGKEAGRRGLIWGGQWRRRSSRWRRYGLGWDPGHIQMPSRRRTMR